MNSVLIYWILGCVVIGLPLGSMLNDCPNAAVNPIDVVTTVATWPATLAAAIVIDRSKMPPRKCITSP